MTITEEIIDVPAEHIRNVFGEFDNHIKRIERTLNVTILARGGSLKVIGSESSASRAATGCEALAADAQARTASAAPIAKCRACRVVRMTPLRPPVARLRRTKVAELHRYDARHALLLLRHAVDEV